MRSRSPARAGTIGTAVCDAPARSRRRGRRPLPRPRRGPSRRNPAVAWHAWDPALERPPEEAFDGVDGVVNLVGEPINQRWTDAAKKRIRESRETATENLVDGDARRAAHARRPRQPSAVGYYGDRGDEVVDESTPPGSTSTPRSASPGRRAARAGERAGESAS